MPPTPASPSRLPAGDPAPTPPRAGTPRPAACWIGVASQDHVARGVAEGFVQVSHGKAGPLERMQPGDGLIYYSPREREAPGKAGGAPLMAFTAIARIEAGPVRLATVDGQPFFRRDARYFPCSPAPIKPLLDSLSFIRSKTHWGAAFRFGVLRIPAEDFARIARAMQCAVGDPAALPQAVST